MAWEVTCLNNNRSSVPFDHSQNGDVSVKREDGSSMIDESYWFMIFENKQKLVGGFNPSEKYESQIGSSSQLLGKS